MAASHADAPKTAPVPSRCPLACFATGGRHATLGGQECPRSIARAAPSPERGHSCPLPRLSRPRSGQECPRSESCLDRRPGSKRWNSVGSARGEPGDQALRSCVPRVPGAERYRDSWQAGAHSRVLGQRVTGPPLPRPLRHRTGLDAIGPGWARPEQNQALDCTSIGRIRELLVLGRSAGLLAGLPRPVYRSGRSGRRSSVSADLSRRLALCVRCKPAICRRSAKDSRMRPPRSLHAFRV